MEVPTVEGLSNRLKWYGFEEFATRLNTSPVLFDDWKRFSKEDWIRIVKDAAAGIGIYNYLHSRNEGIELFIVEIKMEVDGFPEIHGSFKVEQNNEYTQYMKIAATLKDDKSVSEICERLKEITSSILDHDIPFVFLEGSSGSGKSQMAFNIMSRLEKERKCFYFLFETPGASAQKIYLNYRNISSIFNRSLSGDQNHYADSVSPTCGSLFNECLFLYGFIFEVLSQSDRENVRIKPKTGKEVVDLMEKKQISNRRPIFLIDECILPKDDSLAQLRFVRNCFRSLGLGLVMLGTDSRAAQLPSNIGDSSRSDESRPWCHIFGSFPAVNLDLLTLPDNTPKWYQQILENSRPLFSQMLSAIADTNNVENFDSLLKTVFEKVVDVKKIFVRYYGPLGQIRLFQNAHSDISEFGEQSTALIHSHFAQLSGKKKLILKNDGCLSGHDQIWKPSSVFPLVDNDVLLYLLLMGGKQFPAFRMNGRLVPYAYFLLNIISTVDHRRHMLDLSNAAQKSNDGNFLESLLCSTVCAASHYNGIGGINLNSFLLNLIFQLQNTALDPTEISIDGLEKLGTKKTKIPFLSPPNMKWPGYLKTIPKSKFGNLKRARNAERVDLLADCNIAGEAKDYGKILELATLREIISRIPKGTKLHLVFTRTLRGSYFNGRARPFRNEFANSHALNMAYFKIDASKPNTSLEVIDGLPNTVSKDGIIIFVLINNSIQL